MNIRSLESNFLANPCGQLSVKEEGLNNLMQEKKESQPSEKAVLILFIYYFISTYIMFVYSIS